MDGIERQWQLNRKNFEGRWQGTTRWYGRRKDGVLNLEQPELELTDSTYTISFNSPSSGIWHGVGLRFSPGGERRLTLSASTYNQGGNCWQFPGAGGQSSLVVPTQTGGEAGRARFGHEINLFQGRSRTMLVALWLPQPQAPAGARPYRLDQLAVTAFRCNLGVIDPERSPVENAPAQLQQLRGWPGETERLEPGSWPEQEEPGQPGAPLDPAEFMGPGLTAGFADGLITSLPEWLPEHDFQLNVGCMLVPDAFTRISVRFNDAGRLQAWERHRYRADA